MNCSFGQIRFGRYKANFDLNGAEIKDIVHPEIWVSIFDQGRTRLFGEAQHLLKPQPEIRGERRAGETGPFRDGLRYR